MFNAAAGFPPSFPLTIMIPITEARIPIAEMINGNTAAVVVENTAVSSAFATATAARVIAEMMEPA